MSKLQTLKKQVTRQVGIVGGAVVVAFIAMMGSGSLSDGAIQRKNQSQSQYTQGESQLGVMRSQISKSDDAEKRYVDYRLDRDNDEFINNTDGLKELLKSMKEQYRLSDSMKLSISTEKESDRPEFAGLNYKIIVREDMEMSAGAISDVHFYSFLHDMERRMPGIIRFKEVRLTRKSPMSFDALAQLSAGTKLELVDGSVKFTWLTFADKNPPAGAAKDATGATAP